METARASGTSGTRRVRVVHDRVPGRLRLAADLPAALSPADLEAALLDVAAVTAASVRPLTGSIVLSVDPERPAAALLEDVARCLDTGKAPPAPRTAATPPAEARSWHAKSTASVAKTLETSPERGLEGAEARRRLAVHGANRVAVERGEGPLVRLARQFQSAPVIMLAASATASIATGGTADAVATLAVIAVNGTIGFVTEGQAEHTIAALMDTSGRTVTVVRDGASLTIPAADLVPGDLMRLEAGHEIAADGRIVAAEDMSVDESPLTGESLPVPKDPDAAVPPDAPVGARPTMAHAATLVAEGTGLALVTATGRHTEAARIQHLSTTTRRPPARIETELDRLGGQLAGASIAACGVFLALGWLRGYPLPVILKDALALAVAAVPEGLPAVATSTLSLGIRGLERRGILVRKLAAVEQLGAVGVVCLDKTGTLTRNSMAVVETVTGLSGASDAAALAEVAALATDALSGGPAASGTEIALLEMARAGGADAEALARDRPRRLTLPRRAGRPMMATAHDGPEPLLAVKGAPETVLARASSILEAGRARPLTEDDRARLLALNDRLAARPARVIAFARKRLDAVPARLSVEDVKDLEWVGLAAMVDTVRAEAPAFVAQLKRAGIRPVLVTGDQSATAEAIAREVGLAGDSPLRIVDSAELAALPPPLLAELARKADVFSRVSSEQKLLVVRAIQSAGAVVAMTGDGVNDGPALRAADVGIAMGASGADLARDAASVVIRDDDLMALVHAIGRGRSIFRNIRRAVDFLLATNSSEILVSIVEAVHGPGETETPMELLWINLVTDVFPGLGLALAEPDPDAMERPPRDPDAPFLRREDLSRVAVDGATIAVASLFAHGVGLARYGPGPQTRGMTFLSLSMGQLLYTLVAQRTDPRRLDPARLFENRILDLSLLGSMGLAVAPFLVPRLGQLLGVAPLAPRDVAVSGAAAAVPFLAVLARRGVSLRLDGEERKP